MKTNRDYFSWSQYNLFLSSKMQFYKRYVLGDELHLPAFDKGKEFADYRETGEIPHYVEDPLLESVSRSIPVIGRAEKKILTKFGDINILCYIDECKEDLTVFNEYKTGKNPWTQKMVDNHKQLDFYATAIYIDSGEKTIPECNLYWIETEEVNVLGVNTLMYTGHVEKFTKKFDITDIENMASSIYSVYNEILNYEHEEIDLDESIVKRYIEALNEAKKLAAEIDLTKMSILNDLKQVGAKYGSNKLGTFSISERKSPIYSKELLTKEKSYKNEIDKLKKAEKDSPTMKYSITESLLFKENKK